MGMMSRKLRNLEGGRLGYWCQGCEQMHQVAVGEGPGPRWGWNGDAERPTFTPSVLVTGRDFTEKGKADFEAWHGAGCPRPAPHFESKDVVCHTFVGCNGAQPGEVIFLGDCTHALAGTVQPLPDLPGEWRDD